MIWQEEFNRGNYEKASKILIDYLNENSSDGLANEALGLCLYHIGDLEQAEEYMTKAMELTPDSEKLFNIIKIKYELRKYAEVVYLAQRFLEFNRNDKTVLDMLGDSFYYLGNYKEAHKFYKRLSQLSNSEIINEKIIKSQDKLAQQNEKERLEQWGNEFYNYSQYGELGRKSREVSFVSLFKDQVAEYKIVEKLLQNKFKILYQYKILDVGCGDGRWLRKLIDWGANPGYLYGIDVNKEVINLAQRISATGINFLPAHADQLPYEDKYFDIVFCVGVLQHILETDLQQSVGQEIIRVLKDDGIIITINFNKRGIGIASVNDKQKICANGITQTELEAFFPNCVIDYEDAFLSDTMIQYVIPDDWGKMFDLATDSSAINHGFGIAVCKKSDLNLK